MNALTIQKELELAAWELAEAETLERQAKAKRTAAAKRIAASHLEIEIAINEAKNKSHKPNQ